MGQAARLAAVGMVGGLIASAGLTRLLQGLLYCTEPLDPATFGGMAASIFAFIDRPGAREWWHANEERFDPGFRAFINDGLKSGAA